MPFQGEIWYTDQVAYETKITDGGTSLPISCKVLDVRYGIGDKHKELRGFDAPNACHLLEQPSDLTLHLEYIPQCDDTLLAKVANRTATGELNSFGFVIATNRKLAAAADRSHYYLWGCKPKSVRVSSSISNEYTIAIDFSVKEQESSTTDVTYPPEPAAVLSGAYLAFNVAGSIKKGGASIAYLTESIDITIDHDLKDKHDHDSLIKQYAVAGAFSASGSCDISLDEGGRAHVIEILAQTPFDLIVDLGGSGCPRITLKNCQWKSGEVSINVSGDILSDSAPFTGKPSDADLTSIVSATP